jgi:hypothetical protein
MIDGKNRIVIAIAVFIVVLSISQYLKYRELRMDYEKRLQTLKPRQQKSTRG